MSKSHNGTDISLGGAMANIMQSDLRLCRIPLGSTFAYSGSKSGI